MNDEYRLIEPQPAVSLEPCPCCGSTARVWEYTDSSGVVVRVATCDNAESVGPRDALLYNGCLLHMPPGDFYRGTGRDAVRYWNEYARALNAQRRGRNRKRARVLREVTPNVELSCDPLAGRPTQTQG